MKIIKQLFISMLVVLTVISTSSLNSNMNLVTEVSAKKTVKAKKIKLNKTSTTVTKGKTVTLKATITPSNTTSKKVTWSSSNKKIATVSSKGVVKGIKAGTATITAKTSNGKKATCKVTVKNATTSTTKFDTKTNKFTINKNTPTYNNWFKSSEWYNSKTKDYYLIRSYLDRLENMGGGTLTIQKGTYVIPNVLYIASNITIYLEDGVVLKKSYDTGNENRPYAKAVFQIIGRDRINAGETIYQYNGSKNVKIIGKGNATIDLDFCDDSLGFMIGHSENILIQGITFRNMLSNHPIELDGTKNSTITGCKFIGYKPQTHGVAIKEAINIDTPDYNNLCFQVTWSSFDKTPNYNIKITSNTFDKLGTAIGTHRYSQTSPGVNQLHQKIYIDNNKFSNIDYSTIRMQNWNDCYIRSNTFSGKSDQYALYGQGITNVHVTNNKFTGFKGILLATSSLQTDKTEWYTRIYSYVTTEMKREIATKNSSSKNGNSDYKSDNNNSVTGEITNNYYTTSYNITENDPLGDSFTYKRKTTSRYANGVWTDVKTAPDREYDTTKDGVTYHVEAKYDGNAYVYTITSNHTEKDQYGTYTYYQKDVRTNSKYISQVKVITSGNTDKVKREFVNGELKYTITE